MSSLDRTEVKGKSKFIKDVQKLMLFADDSGSDMEELFEDLCDLQDSLCEEIRELEEVDPRIHDPLPPTGNRSCPLFVPPGHLFVPWGSPFYAPGSPFHAPGLLSCDPGASFCALGSTFCTPTKLNLYHISTTNFF